MDILCRRYADVSFLLNNLLLEEIPDFIDFLIHMDVEDKAWEIYINNPLQQLTWEEFRRNIFSNEGVSRTKEEVESEAQLGMLQALDHLNGK